MIRNVKLIHIGWEKLDFTEEGISKLNKEFHYGVYQIYGSHPVYGEDTLLFIGKTHQTKFSERLKGRTEFSELILKPKCIRIGMLYKSDDCDHENWEQMIELSEKILVKAHFPVFNSQGIKGLSKSENNGNYIIKNWGDYGLLLPDIISLNVTFDYWYEFGINDEYIR
jgi:hypothetical protein